MPTVGWILEDAIDRFWESQPFPRPLSATPQRFVCGACGQVLTSAEELRRHYSLCHPLELPSLYVQGEPLHRSTAIRNVLLEKDIEFVQCTLCEVQVDGGAWSQLKPQQFRKRLAQCTSGTWNVRLLHERAEDGARTHCDYHIRLRVADTSTLDAVDAEFVGKLVHEDLRHSDLAKYESSLPHDLAGREYAGALGDYALGVLLKERGEPRTFQVGFEEFASKMRAALDVLCSFDRLVARAVSASIRFNLNDLQYAGDVDGSDLEPGFRFFRSTTGAKGAAMAVDTRSPRRDWTLKRSVCPIDHNSHQLLRACALSLQPAASAQQVIAVLDSVTEGSHPVSTQDLAKFHVLAAEAYLRAGRIDDARDHIQAVQFDPVLKYWARRHLDIITPLE
jgi:hypothetical protein